jgi:hypothetical protein
MVEVEGKICDELNEQVYEHFGITKECFQQSWSQVNLPEN